MCRILPAYISTYLLIVVKSESYDSNNDNLTVNNIIEDLIPILIKDEVKLKSANIQEIYQKLDEIQRYVIPKNEYTKIILNEVSSDKPVNINFFEALKDKNQFEVLSENSTKSLYTKLKEKINRDDIVNILSAKKGSDSLIKSARKSVGGFANKLDNDSEKEELDDVIDRFLAKGVNDDNKYNNNNETNIYWDPQAELEELNDYHRHDGRRIYRGERTAIKFYPFMVSLHLMSRFWCGGSIYWHDLIITSAACLQLMHNNRFFRENPRVLTVRIGSNHSRIGGEVVDALEVYFHPGYNPRTLQHNIAVVRLRRHLSFTYHRIPKCIALGEFYRPPAPTNEVLLLGWGVKKSSQKMSYEPVFLQSKVLPVYPNVFCKEVYGDKFVTTSMFCAGTMSTGESACDHDAGGPAIIGGKLAGIISFGPSICGHPNTPTVFTLIGPYIDWIESVNESMRSYYRGRKKTTSLYRYYVKQTPPSEEPISFIPVIEDYNEASEPEIVTITTPSTTTVITTSEAEYLRKKKKVKRNEALDLSGTGYLSIDV